MKGAVHVSLMKLVGQHARWRLHTREGQACKG